MPEHSPEAAVHELARAWNAGDEDAYLSLFAPDVEFRSSENWPEPAGNRGRETVREFWGEFRAVWEAVTLEVHEVQASRDAAAGRCSWITRGRASGVEGTMEFSITLWVKGAQVVRGQFFDDFEEALAAAGLA